ncbi:MAG: flagellar motor switch protein FliN, partial [Thermoplasmata archaeon]
ALTGRMAEVIETMTGERPTIEWHPEDRPAGVLSAGAASGAMVFVQPFVPGTEATLCFVTPEETWTQIGTRILVAAGVDDGDPGTIRGTFLEIVGQTSSALARAISTRLRREVAGEAGREAALPAGPGDWFGITLRLGDSPGQSLAVSFSDGLARELAGAGPSQEIAAAALPAGAGPALPAPQSPVTSGSLELLLDVELPVSVSFGRAQLALKDVIKLTTGSIVELNRTVSEPVEVIVNNCVIARGEVVVVEGNFGVRILEVVSRQERLRTLD